MAWAAKSWNEIGARPWSASVPDVGAHIFLSYSRGDRPYVSELAAFLADAGVDVWWDGDGPVAGGRDGWVSREAITASAGVVVVLTPRSMSSDRVQDEIKHASDVHKPILALRLEPYPRQDIGIRTAHLPHVAHLHHEEVSSGRMPGPDLVAHLLALTREAAAGPPETAPSPTATAELIAKYLPTASLARLSPTADFNTSNFIQAKLVLVTAADDSATVSIEMNFHVDGETVVKGRQYSVVHEGGGWKVCGPA